ncbi:NAD(P)H-binding protein [Nocardia beijingensis]|uniref:NAD(P)H-binding protein n=1 Tax=Nocardia beijingensis TaxID=95162 RepID=UPI000ACE228C|nr:NAD(P)H-binding protein [Nocardia beijingensis]
MIVITGATGTIGSEIVRQLSSRGTAIRAVTRDPDRADVPAGVEVARGDYTDVASMAKAMAGAEAAFVVGVLGPEYADLDRALIATARDAGVGRIVKLSAIGTGDPGLGRVGTWHMPGEQAARDSGVDWTILRPSSFASNTLSWATAIRAGQPVPNMTGDAAQGVVDPRDVAGVAVEALVSGGHAGRIHTLTGPELLTTHDLAATLATVTGHPVDVTEFPKPKRGHICWRPECPSNSPTVRLPGRNMCAPDTMRSSPRMWWKFSAGQGLSPNGPPITRVPSRPARTHRRLHVISTTSNCRTMSARQR